MTVRDQLFRGGSDAQDVLALHPQHAEDVRVRLDEQADEMTKVVAHAVVRTELAELPFDGFRAAEAEVGLDRAGVHAHQVDVVDAVGIVLRDIRSMALAPHLGEHEEAEREHPFDLFPCQAG
jgi:hypothetical protein